MNLVVETPTRSQSLWLEDGNIVIQAEATQFKVYRGLLTLHSPIFKDMFALPQPPSGEQLVEGCPVVHMWDTAADVSIVLETICLRRWVTSAEPRVLPLEVVAAFLRLGSKYEIESLRAEALKRLLAGIDRNFICYGRGTMIQFKADWKYIDFVNLAREHNALSILPFALYWCCRTWSATELGQGQRRADGTISTLHPVDERACLGAYLEILKLKHITFDWLICSKSRYSHCASLDRCAVARYKVLKNVLFPVSLPRWVDAWDDAYGTGQCDACILVAKQLHNDGRQKVWDALPAAFGLPGWDELNKERPGPAIWCAINFFEHRTAQDTDESVNEEGTNLG